MPGPESQSNHPGGKTLQRTVDNVIRWSLFTAYFNMTGQPAITLPLHWSAEGLPVGVQFAACGREDLLIRIARQLERASPWAARIPPVHA